MVFTLPPWITVLLQVLTIAYAIWDGDVEERLVGWEGAAVLTLDLVYLRPGSRNTTVEYLSIVLELGVALAVALRSNKTWPMVYSSVVLATALTAIAQAAHPVSRWAYGTVQLVWVYLEILIVAAATWRAGRARRAICSQGVGGGAAVDAAA